MRAAEKAAAAAGTAIWVLSLALVALIAASASNITVEVKDAKISVDLAGMRVFLYMHVSITNSGFFDLTDVKVRVGLYDQSGNQLAVEEYPAIIIQAGSSWEVDVMVEAKGGSVEGVIIAGAPLLVKYEADASIAGLIPVAARFSSGIRLGWG